MRILCTVLGVLVLLGATGSARQTEYALGPEDVVTITVYDQPDLSGSYTIDPDGSLIFPLIGRMKAEGLSLRALEEEIRSRLADGYLRNPQISASVEQYRSQRIFVMGEVRAPGAYPLGGDMTIIEAISRAGGPTAQSADEVLVVRPAEGQAEGPLAPDAEDSTILRVSVRDIQQGALSKNIMLRGGDTLVVQRAKAVYVFGQVNAPGAYAVEDGMTVLQALSVAGGVTDRGSTGRIEIVRTVDGKKKEIKVKLSDLVQPGDTIIVKERFF